MILLGVADDTMMTKFTGRTWAVHCNSLQVVVMVLKFPIVIIVFDCFSIVLVITRPRKLFCSHSSSRFFNIFESYVIKLSACKTDWSGGGIGTGSTLF